jgi:hypothetical protein
MSRWKLLLLSAVVVVAVFAMGKFLVLALLTLLLPVYAMLLASIFLILFILLAIVIVPIGHKLIERHNQPIVEHDGEQRRAA